MITRRELHELGAIGAMLRFQSGYANQRTLLHKATNGLTLIPAIFLPRVCAPVLWRTHSSRAYGTKD